MTMKKTKNKTGPEVELKPSVTREVFISVKFNKRM